MEAQWILVLLQHLLLFEGDHLPPFDNILHSLRSSLVTTLAIHVRLIGKLYYLADIGESLSVTPSAAVATTTVSSLSPRSMTLTYAASRATTMMCSRSCASFRSST
jgi:hypothetical protein